MKNLHLKNLNNTNPIEYYFKNQKLDNNNNIVENYIDDIKNNKEEYLNIENLKNIKNSINSIKTILNNGELVIDILKYKI